MKTKIKNIPATLVTLALALLALLSCSRLDELLLSRNRPEVQIVIGDVTATRSHSELRVRAGFLIEPQDVITVGRNSRVKFSIGQNNVYANENSLFALASPSSPDSGMIILQNGDYYFSVEGNQSIKFAFGDISVEITDGTAALMIGDLGRLAEFFVISGRAIARRGNREMLIGTCRVVVLDAFGISDDAGATAERGNTLNWLAAWVGGPTIRRAADDGGCYVLPFGQIEFEYGWDTFDDSAIPSPPRAPAQERMAPRRADTRRVNLQPVVIPPPRPAVTRQPPEQPRPAPPRRARVRIEQITGPARVHATEEFTLRAVLSGDETPDVFVWHVDRDGDLHTHRTTEPHYTTALPRSGDHIITVEARMEDGRIVSARRVRLHVNSGQVVLTAGGPYRSVPGVPAQLLGNARSRFSDIVRYEWLLPNVVSPIYSSGQNGVAMHTFNESGEFAAIYRVTLADGSFATDTARIIIGDESETPAPLPTTTEVQNDDPWFDDDAPAAPVLAEATPAHAPPPPPAPTPAPAPEPEPVAATPAPSVTCPDGMIRVTAGGQLAPFCIDRYEFPNTQGAMPRTSISRADAIAACESVGKRLCTIEEWQTACAGGGGVPDGRVYPYGETFENSRCNTVGNAGAVAASGSFGTCANALSIFDMSGNAAEWVAPAEGSAMAFAYGGFHASGAPAAACDSRISVSATGQFAHVGFRCCRH